MADEDSEDRSEAATPRHLQRARDAGSVAVSREAAVLAGLAAMAAMLALQGPTAASTLRGTLAGFLDVTQTGAPALALRAAGLAVAGAAGPFLLVALLAGTAAVLAQTGGAVNLAALLPDPARLSPTHGWARILSLSALTEVGKALVKLAASVAVVWSLLPDSIARLSVAAQWDPATLLDRTGRDVLRVLLGLLGVQAAITAADVARSRISHAAGLRMTRQQVREEHKETEGDPHIKARVKRLRLQRSKRRMLAAVPKAAVVITNPTHYAVALAYERGSSAAPRVIAKGVDSMAARIRDTARAHGVPLVANPPLARALYPLELDREIPRELFQAVADIIAYLWGLRRRTV